MKLAVIGVGHVGLVTAATLANVGHEVGCVDVDVDKIASLQEGKTPFYEPGLDELVTEGVATGRLRFSSDPAEVIAGAEVVFICVGTPPDASGDADLAAVEHSSIDIGRSATGPFVVVQKSTVPAGTAERVRETLRRGRPDLEFHVVSNPEFLREGQAVHDSLEPDRLLIGADDEAGFEAMRRVYAPITERGYLLIETDVVTAELSKHASNAFLAMKISYANALARICERVGADVDEVTRVMGADPRIGASFLRAGIGFGGYCFPKDLSAFERLAQRAGYPFPLLAEVARLNEEAVTATIEKIRNVVWNLSGKRIALLGLSFKPGTDDVRFSPALEVARRLLALRAEVVGVDPQAGPNALREVAELTLAVDAYEAAEGAHALVLTTEWQEFAALDFGRLREAMAVPVLVDGRNFLDPRTVAGAGLAYHPIGRRSLSPEPAGTER
jgi:UDPglucose 6-dehydrogenase